MCTKCDKQLNLGKLVFDEENHERKSWKSFGRTCNRFLLVFVSHFFVIVLILACAIVRIMLSTTSEATTVWEQFYQVQSVIFSYIKKILSENEFLFR